MVEFQYEFGGKSYPVRIKKEGEGYTAVINEVEYDVTSKEIKPGFFLHHINGQPAKITLVTEGNQRHIFYDGSVYRFTRIEGRRKKKDDFDKLSPKITSPISGKVVKVDAVPGAEVGEGQTLMAIEAMKMEYQIKAPFDGKVDKVYFEEGQQVDIGVVIVELIKDEDTSKEEA